MSFDISFEILVLIACVDLGLIFSENLVLITRVALPGGMKFPANLVLIACIAHKL